MNPRNGADIKRTAMVIGATGLVGAALVKQLLEHPLFEKVIIFVRRSAGVRHEKLTEHIIDFDKPPQWERLVKGDVLFSALGTTLKQAGSKAAQYKVDYTYQYQFAAAAARNNVPAYVLVSSVGASERSLFFYPRIKGELEREVKKLPFRRLTILQPGFLAGERKEKRTMETVSLAILKGINSLGALKTYRPIEGATVARAMINAALQGTGQSATWKGEELFVLAGS